MEVLAEIKQSGGITVCRAFISSGVTRHGYFVAHRHTELELSLILGGSGIYRASDKVYPIKEGDIFLYCTNEQHCVTDADNLSLFNIHFSPRFFPESEDAEPRFLSVFYHRKKDFSNRIESSDSAAQHTAFFMKKIMDECRDRKDDFEQMTRAYLTEALVNILRETQIADTSSPMPSKSSESRMKIWQAIDYIDSHFTSDISLSDVASRVALSRTYFSSLFSEYCKMTMCEYITIKRIELAKKLLRTTESTVLSVALECGFNNAAHFYRCFKAVTAVSPAQYRAEAKSM